MFKRFLSGMAAMLLAFGMNVEAQVLSAHFVEDDGPVAETALPKTSKINLNGDEFWWGYWDGNLDKGISSLGTGSSSVISEEYNACIGIPAEIGSGLTIEGIKFILTSIDVVEKDNVKIWISTELPKSPEEANITCQLVPADQLTDRKHMQDRTNEIRFDKPYVVPENTMVYVGYTFVLTSNESTEARYPLMVQKPASGETRPHSAYVKFGTSENPSWRDLVPKNYGSLTEQVLVSGEFAANAAMIQPSFPDIYSSVGGDVKIPIEITNQGTEGFSKIGLIIDINGDAQQFDVEVPEKMGKITGIGTKFNFNIAMEDLSEEGVMNMKITVDKVNGKPNESKDNVLNGKVIVLSSTAKKKVLVEEFTGLWCGACPMGIVGLQRLKNLYPEDVVVIGLHKNDPMQCSDYLKFMKDKAKNSYPNCHMDRTYLDIYPYSGTGKNGYADGVTRYGLGNDAAELLKAVSIADIEAGGSIDGDILTAKSTVNFLISGQVNCGIAYVLTEDGLQDDTWIQSNYLGDYAGRGYEDEEPLFDMWVNGGRSVSGVVFDDVAIAAQGAYEGVEGSVPEVVTADIPMTFETEFNLSDYSLIQDRDKLSLVVFIIDKNSGKVINVDRKPVSVLNKMDGIESDDENIEEVARYTLDGRRISVPEKGVNVIKMSDGTVKKVVVR